jgi:hypothetical protein
MTSRPSANFCAGEIDRVQNYTPGTRLFGPKTNAWVRLTVSAKGRGDMAASAHNIAHLWTLPALQRLSQCFGIRALAAAIYPASTAALSPLALARSANQRRERAKSWGIRRLLTVPDHRWRSESLDSNVERRPRACRSEQHSGRRGRVARLPCSSASAASCSCAWPRSR